MRDEDYRRYVRINLPHARTIGQRIARTLDALDGFGHEGNGQAQALSGALASSCRSDRLGQHVRNFFECLGLHEEGADLALKCGERSDSPLHGKDETGFMNGPAKAASDTIKGQPARF